MYKSFSVGTVIVICMIAPDRLNENIELGHLRNEYVRSDAFEALDW